VVKAQLSYAVEDSRQNGMCHATPMKLNINLKARLNVFYFYLIFFQYLQEPNL